MNKLFVVLLVSGLVLISAGCKKKEEKPQLPSGHPSMESGMPPAGMPNAPKIDRTIVVPKGVSAKWKAVQLTIEDKASKVSKQYTVAIGSDLAVPNSKITIKVLAFLPDFRMSDKEITSVSDKPNNPAVQVAVQEPGKEEWKGWIYSMHPEIHPFTHEKIAITLMGGVAK